MGNISKDFSYKEFSNSRIARQRGICNEIISSEVRDNIYELVHEVLQPLRSAWGEPLKVNSGYRCPELNAAVNGQPTSQHLKGEAADIAAENPLKLAQLAKDLKLPFDQMILYPTFVHFSHSRTKVQRNQILYNRRWKGGRLK